MSSFFFGGKNKASSSTDHSTDDVDVVQHFVKLDDCCTNFSTKRFEPITIDIYLSGSSEYRKAVGNVNKRFYKNHNFLRGIPDVNIPDGSAQTVLMTCALDPGRIDCLSYLLTCPDIGIDLQNSQGQTALWLAAAACNVKAVKMLLDFAQIEA